MSAPLTRANARALDALQRLASSGESPTLAELAAEVGCSVGAVRWQVSQLERKGQIRVHPGVHRGIEILAAA